ncbi:MAG: Two-component system sensor histidine kinase [uncultured Rubrobacteraceae bacterium]|uniref:Sensor-like histidine kinase SenX3 n=1 Tax=uncultured Rubrobacteraceae bacterium TaxID=349277 RepID=A0A6J4SIN8_9ACTN|nr:MAG: Two-component system sensor histidine kinase [uncultured Rubrobacteraceae bacterium]
MGISSVAILIIGLVLYSFAQNQLVRAEKTLLEQRSQTANAGAQDFLESQRDPEDQSLPSAEDYAEELVTTVADPTGLRVLYVGTGGEPLAARDGYGNPADPKRELRELGLPEGSLGRAVRSTGGEGRLDWSEGRSGYVAVWPLVGRDGTSRGAMIYDVPRDEIEDTLSYLRYGIFGAILASVLLAAAASLFLARQLTRPLSETRDAAIRVASGDYTAEVPVKGRDELGELARAFNYMAEEIEHYVGEIQEQKSRLEAVLEASPEAVVATDPAGRVTMVNPAAARMLGVRHSDQGRPLDELGTPDGIVRCVREAAANGVAVREVEFGEKTFWAYAARMDRRETNGSGNDAGIILAVRDITEHRSLEKAKTAFVSDFSHELRTPLTTIQSAVGLLERARERLDPLEHRALELAEGELARIRGMVDELMTLAQMDSWQYQLEVGPANLGEVIRTAMRSVETKAQRFGIEVYFEDGAEHRCVCDVQKLYQVFLNLLDNAIKYSDPGDRVDVTVDESPSWITVSIKDTGIGIPPEDLEQLFERFYRVNKDRSRATGGSGLGLAISKQIVEMHGGGISVESEVNQGSTFLVHLPTEPLSRSSTYAM